MNALDSIADTFCAWIKDAFQGLIVTEKTTPCLSGRIHDQKGAVAYKIKDEQYPFGGDIAIGLFQTDGGVLEVYQWCTRYDYQTDPSQSMRARRGLDRLGGGTVIDLGNPNALPIAMDKVMDIGMDYCRMLYRRSIKARRKHLKPLVHKMMELFIQERRRCKARNYQLGD